MNVEFFGRVRQFKDVTPGALFRGASGSREHLAIKVTTAEWEGWVVLDQANPHYEGRLGVTRASVGAGDRSAFELPEAVLRPSLDREDWLLSKSAEYGSGDLVIGADGSAYLCVTVVNPGYFSSDPLLDLKTGQLGARVDAVAVVKKWSVVQLVDDEPYVLAAFERRQAAGQPEAAAE